MKKYKYFISSFEFNLRLMTNQNEVSIILENLIKLIYLIVIYFVSFHKLIMFNYYSYYS